MTDIAEFYQRWEVRPTLRLPTLASPPDQATLDSVDPAVKRVADELRQSPNFASVHIGLEIGQQSMGITATIVLAQPSTPGAAVDEATNLLVKACATAGLQADVIKEIVVEMTNDDPRSL